MDQSSVYGFADFLAQSDWVARSALATLCVMSVASWYVILTKVTCFVVMRRRTNRFLKKFWASRSMQAVALWIDTIRHDEPFGRLTAQAIAAAHQHTGMRDSLSSAGDPAEHLTRSMRALIDEETASIESGLTLLASVGSTAPFVGLFGTVWGVYHALVNIGMMGQGTLDRVAGPVGEALIMTALGLAVAIPAVLAYNSFTRSNHLFLSRLDAFAHSLYSFLMAASHEKHASKSLQSVTGGGA